MHSQQTFNECIAKTGDEISLSQSSSRPDGRLYDPDSNGCVQFRNRARPTTHRVERREREGARPQRIGVVSTYFPAAHSEEEAHHIGLLLLLKLFDILEGTHLGYWREKETESAQGTPQQYLTKKESIRERWEGDHKPA